MTFQLPPFKPPDFDQPPLNTAPAAALLAVEKDGVAPVGYHATSNHPEYVRIEDGNWLLATESRMDGVLVLKDNFLEVKEPRSLRRGELVLVGRSENGEEGILVHADGFKPPTDQLKEKFSFRTRDTRETPFSRSYDELYDLLRYEKEQGYIVWVLGPAAVFDRDSRAGMQGLIEHGFCHALLAGNALATHDIEAALFGTGLGQDIYSQKLHTHGHYHHLDAINQVRQAGSIRKALPSLAIKDGIMYACENKKIPYVLAGSIRDDGPLPEVIADAYEAQKAMRCHTRKATTVISVATQLHSIATGNMTPGYTVTSTGRIRPVYFYIVDMTEFSADKLANRGSIQARSILTNAQDFIVNLWHNLSS
jgi:lysine-ketoglutarate reductase/saccharopine dehydrogenase-like protein (TIGR00300 family)